MAEPQTQTQTPEKEEKIIFYRHYFFEFFRKKIYVNSEALGEVEEVKVNGDIYRVNTDDEYYSEILRSLSKKIEILGYVSDETFEAMTKEIVLDIAKILFKLEKGNKF